MDDTMIRELRSERENTLAQHRAFLDSAAARGRFDAADRATDARFTEEIDSLGARITDLEQRSARDRMRASERSKIEVITGRNVNEAERRSTGHGDADLRAVFTGKLGSLSVNLGEVRTIRYPDGRYEVRALGTTSTAAGGALVPTSFHTQIVEYMTENAAIRQTGITLLQTTTGAALPIPQLLSHGTAVIVGEGTAAAGSDPSFGTASLGAWKYAQLLQLPRELVQDQQVDLLSFVARDMGRALGEASGGHYVTGSGTNQPQGVMTVAGTGVIGAGTVTPGVPTDDELVDLFYSVPGAARNRGTWFMASATMAALRKIKDSSGRYMIVDLGGLQIGAPAQILGRPIVTDENVAAAGTSALSIAFGAFDSYWIRDVAEVELAASTDFAFDTDMITYRAILRSDARLCESRGIRVFKGGTA
jgi:HK97 family phage major capsid protein